MARDYNAEARRRRRFQKRVRGYFRFALCVAGILLVSLAITKVIEGGSRAPAAASEPAGQAGVSAILAPLPMQGGTAAQAAVYGPEQQQPGGYTVRPYDSTTIRLAARGQVSLDYFSDAAFLGDSLTEGFTEYNINLSGALICGYVGVGPSQIVNRAAVTHPERGQEVALDVLAAAAPKKLYVLLGTNTLTVTGTEQVHKNAPWRRTTVCLEVQEVIPAETVKAQRSTALSDAVWETMRPLVDVPQA